MEDHTRDATEAKVLELMATSHQQKPIMAMSHEEGLEEIDSFYDSPPPSLPIAGGSINDLPSSVVPVEEAGIVEQTQVAALQTASEEVALNNENDEFSGFLDEMHEFEARMADDVEFSATNGERHSTDVTSVNSSTPLDFLTTTIQGHDLIEEATPSTSMFQGMNNPTEIHELTLQNQDEAPEPTSASLQKASDVQPELSVTLPSQVNTALPTRLAEVTNQKGFTFLSPRHGHMFTVSDKREAPQPAEEDVSAILGHAQLDNQQDLFTPVKNTVQDPSEVEDMAMSGIDGVHPPSSGSKASLYDEMRDEEARSSTRPSNEGVTRATVLTALKEGGTIAQQQVNQENAMETEESGSGADAPRSPTTFKSLLKNADRVSKKALEVNLDVGESMKPEGDSLPDLKEDTPMQTATEESTRPPTPSEPSAENVLDAMDAEASAADDASKVHASSNVKLKQPSRQLRSEGVKSVQAPPSQVPQKRKQGGPLLQFQKSTDKTLSKEKSSKEAKPSPQIDGAIEPKRQRYELGHGEIKNLQEPHIMQPLIRGAGRTRAQKEDEAKKQAKPSAAAKSRHRKK